MFSKILIANRGEIAVRIIRACKEMGIISVAIYSEEDKDALHTLLADEKICIGPASSEESYLNKERIIAAALATKANAIHPGYGFLSENGEFASLARKNGLAFIGPSEEEMEKLSDKAGIKKRIRDAGLDVIPGTDTLSSVDEALSEAEKLGYPVMLKARSGGGGKGIRPAYSPEELREVFPIAEKESESAFGDKALYLEKCITPAHHIEVQILADEVGNVVSLGERECSIQRHHQKLIEESPSPAVSEEMRKKLLKRSVEAIKKIGYTGVGTLEFLLDQEGNFYFMEMNVRLQVEHGVTEMLTGIDLVKWQIRIAAGIPISFTEKDVRLQGFAVECRINALTPGVIKDIHVPGGPFVRFDTYLARGTKVSPYYDSLVGKLIVYTKSREESMRKMRAYLCELVIDGIRTNIGEDLRIISDPRFMSGNYDTNFLEGI